MNRQELPAKLVGTNQLVIFDFLSDLAPGESISGQTVAPSVYSGTDAVPGALLSGAAIQGPTVSTVSQRVVGGIVGTMYELLCTVTTSSGQTLQKVGVLAVVPDL